LPAEPEILIILEDDLKMIFWLTARAKPEVEKSVSPRADVQGGGTRVEHLETVDHEHESTDKS